MPSAQPSVIKRRVLRMLLPLDNGPQEIRALDGLRAIAALSIVVFHSYQTANLAQTSWGSKFFDQAYFLATGVHLFFVLSGFLLFLPYARAMLHAKPLPSARQFYRRRALRILPAYWVCLLVLAIIIPATFSGLTFAEDMLTHITLIHDYFPSFNRDIEGPFWTLAVEWQFYLLLPVIGVVIARIVGVSRSIGRIAACIGGLIGLSLTMRVIGTLLMAYLPSFHGIIATIGQIITLLILGSQGKFLEVFAVGMLCATLYVATIEEHMLSAIHLRRFSWFLLVEAIVLLGVLTPFWYDTVPEYVPGGRLGFGLIAPLYVGLGYGALLLAIVWGGRLIHTPFEFYPLRFIGLISFSLYMWHLPITRPLIPALESIALGWRLPLAFLVAYLSYQLVERPFLSRRHKHERIAMLSAIPPLPAEKVIGAD